MASTLAIVGPFRNNFVKTRKPGSILFMQSSVPILATRCSTDHNGGTVLDQGAMLAICLYRQGVSVLNIGVLKVGCQGGVSTDEQMDT